MRSILSRHKCQLLKPGPQQIILPDLTKHYTSSRYASAALQQPSAHIQAVDLESCLDSPSKNVSFHNIRSYIIYVHATQRGGEVTILQRWQSLNKYNLARE